MNTICLKTNQHRLIANLRYAFTPYSMLGELLQNARRAQASVIHVTASGNILSVSDDGTGIADLQSLIFIAESGWDQHLQTDENAFGMGVLSTLYFAEQLFVHSGNQSFHAPTAAIIRGDAIKVQSEPHRTGTEIRLDGVQSPQAKLSLSEWVAEQLKRLCEAFPVRVLFNGTEMARPLAQASLQWKKTFMGHVLINLSGYPSQSRCFLQGLPIGKTIVATNHQVVMLNNDTLARLPDRQYLLNEAEDYQRIQTAINEAYRQALIEAKEQLAGHAFLERYGETCLSSKNADLLNDLPFVLCEWFRNWADNPAGYCRSWERYSLRGIAARSEVEETGVWSISDDIDDGLAAETYLNERKAFLLEEDRLDANHWLLGMRKTIAADQVQIRHSAILHEESSPPLTEYIGLALVETLFVSVEGEPGEYPVKAVRKGEMLYLTPAADSVTPLISDYVYDDIYNEDRENEDAETLRTFIAVGCSHDPRGVVSALLPASLRYTPQPKLAGVKVHLVFDNQGKLQDVGA